MGRVRITERVQYPRSLGGQGYAEGTIVVESNLAWVLSSTSSSALAWSERFELGDEIGRGGMGSVHLAVDRVIGRDGPTVTREVLAMIRVALAAALCCAPLAAQEPSEPRAGLAVRTALGPRSTLSTPDEMMRRFGWTAAMLEGAGHRDYTLAEESFRVYLPRAHEAATPCGLLVWIDPSDRGGPFEGWHAVLDRFGLMCAGPERAGNERLVPVRIGLAIDTVHALSQRYKLAPERVYVAGFSGGGRTAAMAAHHFPEVFTGGALLCGGAGYHRELRVPDRPGVGLPMDFRPPPADRLALGRERAFVLWTGERDPNTEAVRLQHAAMVADGYRRAQLVLAPARGHEPPDADELALALAALGEKAP